MGQERGDGRYIATSVAGFVQQLAVAYITHGYYFFVTGRIAIGMNAHAIDAKLIAKHGCDESRWSRCRRRALGEASVHYLRHERFFILIATRGDHRFFADEPNFKDVRRDPVVFKGYSISLKEGADGASHPSVRIHPRAYRKLRGYLLTRSLRLDADRLGKVFYRIPFEPYAPVRRQLLNLLRVVNRRRKVAGLETLPHSVLRLRRRPVRPFAHVAEAGHASTHHAVTLANPRIKKPPGDRRWNGSRWQHHRFTLGAEADDDSRGEAVVVGFLGAGAASEARAFGDATTGADEISG